MGDESKILDQDLLVPFGALSSKVDRITTMVGPTSSYRPQKPSRVKEVVLGAVGSMRSFLEPFFRSFRL